MKIRSVTCACAGGDWITDDWADWITPCTWNWPLGSWTTATWDPPRDIFIQHMRIMLKQCTKAMPNHVCEMCTEWFLCKHLTKNWKKQYKQTRHRLSSLYEMHTALQYLCYLWYLRGCNSCRDDSLGLGAIGVNLLHCHCNNTEKHLDPWQISYDRSFLLQLLKGKNK